MSATSGGPPRESAGEIANSSSVQIRCRWRRSGDGPVTRFENSAVRDVTDWHCRNDHFEHTMTDGQYIDSAEPPFTRIRQLFYQAPRWRWWMVKLSELGGKRWLSFDPDRARRRLFAIYWREPTGEIAPCLNSTMCPTPCPASTPRMI